MKNVLNAKMGKNDIDAKTIRDYLRALLLHLWEEEERFSGKRPFGNSGWKHGVWIALLKAKLVKGKLDDDGYVDEIDKKEAELLIAKAIKALK